MGVDQAWEAVQLAWTCDLMSADVLKTLDPLKLSAAPTAVVAAGGAAAAATRDHYHDDEIPDTQTLLNYSSEHGALRMWPEVYDKCLAEVSRLTWNECPERAAVLERLRARTSRLFTFAHKLLAAYRRRLGEKKDPEEEEEEEEVGVESTHENNSQKGRRGGGGDVEDDDDDRLLSLREKLKKALADLAAERAARATAAARVASLEAELLSTRSPDARVPTKVEVGSL